VPGKDRINTCVKLKSGPKENKNEQHSVIGKGTDPYGRDIKLTKTSG